MARRPRRAASKATARRIAELRQELDRAERQLARELRGELREQVTAARKRSREAEQQIAAGSRRIRDAAAALNVAGATRYVPGRPRGAPKPAAAFRRLPGAAARYVDIDTGEQISRRERDRRVEAAGGRRRATSTAAAEAAREFSHAARLYQRSLARRGVRVTLREVRANHEIVREIAGAIRKLRSTSGAGRWEIIDDLLDDFLEYEEMRELYEEGGG